MSSFFARDRLDDFSLVDYMDWVLYVLSSVGRASDSKSEGPGFKS